MYLFYKLNDTDSFLCITNFVQLQLNKICFNKIQGGLYVEKASLVYE